MATRIFLTVFFLLLTGPAAASDPAPHLYGDDDTVIGAVQKYEVDGDESLIEIAREFGTGYNEIVAANPRLDPFLPGAGAEVTVPTSWALPEAEKYEGIIINLSEMRLYYFFRRDGSARVVTFPIGIGDEGTDTPTGNFRIIEKLVRPSWHVPKSVRKEKPELPNVVPPGPENPLGSHALRLSLRTYLIHGTNKPWGVGRKVSHGCIRLYPEDIPELFEIVPGGAAVTIVKQPVKVGVSNSRIFIEVHNDDDFSKTRYFQEAVRLLGKKKLTQNVSTERLYHAIKEKRGVPVDISIETTETF